MASDELYEACLPILKDDKIDDEDKTDKLEELVKTETTLTDKALGNTVLDILWRYRNSTSSDAAPSPVARHAVIRRTQSPARWAASSRSGTPAMSSPRSSAASPAPPPGLSARPALMRMKSSQQSPFTSPRSSPRLAFASPYKPRSPGLDSARGPGSHTYADFGSENGDWVGSEDSFNASAAYISDSGDASAATAPWMQQMTDMGPYDILRSIIGDQKTDEEIESILEANGYDLSAAIASLMGNDSTQMATGLAEQDKSYLVGKSMLASRPVTPSGQQKSPVVCRYWLSTGACLRADCRFSHDLSSHICKYWLAGNCLAGDSCIFSHDLNGMMSGMSIGDSPYPVAPSMDAVNPNIEVQDYQAFPSLQPSASSSSLKNLYNDSVSSLSAFSSRQALAPEFIPSSQQYSPRPMSRQSPLMQNAALSTDDGEAFPSLSSAAVRGPKKHHGKRGHGHGHRERENPNSLADVVRMSPNPQSCPRGPKARPFQMGTKEPSAAAQAIPAPEHIPWLETGAAANKAYLKARQDAIRHGGARNKFLQSAAQAWNRNDVRAAKALSLRGQSENDLMREAHREAARHLYEKRNKSQHSGGETYVDLHGLHPAEAVSYLTTALNNQKSASAVHRDASQVLYAIVGTGHHSKGGRDKVGKAVRNHLNDCRYVFREFSVPGDRGGSGGILGVDVKSGGSAAADTLEGADEETSGPSLQHGKVRILKADEARAGGL